MPKDSFEMFKKDITELYPDEAISCDSTEWCYYNKACEDYLLKMPSLRISLKTNSTETPVRTYSIPPISFLYNFADKADNSTTCHVMIVEQQS